MIDVNKITSTLAKLPDAQLQQYAQMHKSDPYIMALAMTESNRRKEMRSAGQGAQGVQEQPKVVDQAVAEMAPQQLPEDMGIGQLPAGDMNFAGGGIVAFADGGDVMYDPVTGVPIYDTASQGGTDDRTILERLGIFNPENRRALEKAEKATAQKSTALPYGRATMPTASYTRTDPRAAGASAFADSVKAVTGAPAVKPSAAPAAGGKPAAAALGFREQYLKDLEGMGPGKAQTLEEIQAERATLMPKDKAFAGLEAALSKEAEGVEGEKKDALWMAVTQAGLAAAAGASPYALKNIAEGFGTGLAGYKESLKEFKKADKERQKAMADIEQARRAEARGDVDTAMSLREKSQDRMDKFNDRKAAGLAAITGSEISAAASKYAADSSAASARLAANRTPAELQLIERYGNDPKFAAAYDKFAQAKRDPQTAETLMKAWSGNVLLQQQYPNPQDYIKMMSGSSSGAGEFKVLGVRNP